VAPDNHFLLPFTKIVVRVEQRLEMSKAVRPAWFMRAPSPIEGGNKEEGDFGKALRLSIMRPLSPVLSSIPRVYTAYNVPGVRVISCFLHLLPPLVSLLHSSLFAFSVANGVT